MDFTNSNDLLLRAEAVTPLATQTFSKGPHYWPIGAAPLFMDHAKGCYTWDVDGNKYCDWVMGLGAVTLGYRNKAVDDSIRRQLHKGITFSQSSPLEAELAEMLSTHISCADMVRFTKTGSSATEAAVRIARSYTKKPVVCGCGYSGWHSWSAAATDRPGGTLLFENQYHRRFDYNDIAGLERKLQSDDVAAVILEPVIVTAPAENFLQKVRELCTKHHCLLIFDEMVTGFRWGMGGAAEHFGVMPDLATIGKGMANGMPLAAVVGKDIYMHELEDVFVSTTFGGECLSLAAGIATIKEMRRKDYINHIWRVGVRIMGGFNREMTAAGSAKIIGYSCRPKIELPAAMSDKPAMTLLTQELISRGQLVHNGGIINISLAHGDREADQLVEALLESVEVVRRAVAEGDVSSQLRGKLVQPAFKRL
jgi:glutamate-1-semialdehyde aminotransferase